MGVYVIGGRAVISTDPQANIAIVFSFPPATSKQFDLVAVSEKVFVPTSLQLKEGQKLFAATENQSVLMLNLEDSAIIIS